MKRVTYSGIIPPLVTPIDSNGTVDKKSVQKLIEYVRPYSMALMPTLSSGEGWALSAQQWVDMVKYTIEFAKGLPVLAGIELPTTEEVIVRAKIARALGVDAIVVTTPFLRHISQNKIYKHFARIVKSVDIPLFIYNEESISGNAICLNTLKRILQLKNVVGVKEASGSAEFTNTLLQINSRVPLFQGWENLCLDTPKVHGYILPLSNIEPAFCKEMFVTPTAEKQQKINMYCTKYDLLGKTWYVSLKKELYKRNIISTAQII